MATEGSVKNPGSGVRSCTSACGAGGNPWVRASQASPNISIGAVHRERSVMGAIVSYRVCHKITVPSWIWAGSMWGRHLLFSMSGNAAECCGADLQVCQDGPAAHE